jgi:hypothetical protein
MKFNSLLMAVSFVVFCGTLYHAVPLKITKGFLWFVIPVVVFCIAALVVAVHFDTPQKAMTQRVMPEFLGNVSRYLPMLVPLMLTMAITSILTEAHMSWISGKLMHYGHSAVAISSAIAPTPSVVARGVNKLWDHSPEAHEYLLAFVVVSRNLSICILIVTMIGIENRQLIRQAVMLNIMAGACTILFCKLLYHFRIFT